jgi:hypothetical protein
MTIKSHILADFNGLDVASNDTITKRLRMRRYNLHKGSLWQGEYIRPAKEVHTPDKSEDPNPIMLRLSAGVQFIIYIMVVAIANLVFVLKEQAHFIRIQIPLVLTALAIGVKLG